MNHDPMERAEERAGIMEYDGGLTREQADTYSRKYLLECLARDILAEPVKNKRRKRLAEWRKKHGDKSADDLERVAMVEHEKAVNEQRGV